VLFSARLGHTLIARKSATSVSAEAK